MTLRDVAFWLAVGLSGFLTTVALKYLAARFRLPRGFEELAGAA